MSYPHGRRRRGRPSALAAMNIRVSDIEDVAEAIKLRILANGGTWEISVGPDGAVYDDNLDSSGLGRPLPESWLVGTYTTKARVSMIEDDLMIRLREIERAGAR